MPDPQMRDGTQVNGKEWEMPTGPFEAAAPVRPQQTGAKRGGQYVPPKAWKKRTHRNSLAKASRKANRGR